MKIQRSFLFILAALVVSANVQAATLTIKTPFEGQPPAPEKIKADADPKCKLAHPEGFTSDEVLVNANGTLKNVLAYAKEGVTGKFEAPKESVVFDQKGCQYTPHVFGIQVGQNLEILNSDDTLHNVHALPSNKSQSFNLGMPIKGMKLKKTFTQSEVPVKIKCEVHPWMLAYAGVLDHPFYGVTGDDGSAVIKDLPAGEYTIEAWHEKYGAQQQKVTMADADQEITFNFKAA